MKPYVKGVVTMTTTDAVTGKVIDVYVDDNMVVDIGVYNMWRRGSTLDETNQLQLNTIHFGSDYGPEPRWGIFNPEPPSRKFIHTTQDVNHVVNPDLVEYKYPRDDVLQVECYLNGTDFMNSNFPADVDFRWTSMTLRFMNGDIFAYKRFPIRSISRHVNVTIDWRFTIVNSDEWCGLGGHEMEADDVYAIYEGIAVPLILPSGVNAGVQLTGNATYHKDPEILEQMTQGGMKINSYFASVMINDSNASDIKYSDNGFVTQAVGVSILTNSVEVDIEFEGVLVETVLLYAAGGVSNSGNTNFAYYYDRQLADLGAAAKLAKYPTIHSTRQPNSYDQYISKPFKLTVRTL